MCYCINSPKLACNEYHLQSTLQNKMQEREKEVAPKPQLHAGFFCFGACIMMIYGPVRYHLYELDVHFTRMDVIHQTHGIQSICICAANLVKCFNHIMRHESHNS